MPSDLSDFSDSEDLDASPRKASKPKRKLAVYTGGVLPAADSVPTEGDEVGRVPNATAWTPAEDAILLAAVEKHGPRWQHVAQELWDQSFHRTTAMARNRFQRIQAPSKPGKAGRNKCKRCGQIKRGHTCTAEDPVVAVRPLPAGVVPTATPPSAGGDRRPIRRLLPGDEEVGYRATPAKRARDAVLAPSLAYLVTRTRPRESSLADPSSPLLRDHSLLTRASGNDFKVDVEAFLQEVHRRNAEVENLHPHHPPTASPMLDAHLRSSSMVVPPTASALCADFASDDAALTFLASGVSPRVAVGGGDAPPSSATKHLSGAAESVRTRVAGSVAASRDGAAPPFVAPPPSASSAAPLRFSFGGASVISDRADLVHLADLTSAADAALAAHSCASFGGDTNTSAQQTQLGGGGGVSLLSTSSPDADAPRAEDEERTMADSDGEDIPDGSFYFGTHAACDVSEVVHPSARLLLPGAMVASGLSTSASRAESPLAALFAAEPALLRNIDLPPSAELPTAPPLMPLPSWSRAPSFSFADRPAYGVA